MGFDEPEFLVEVARDAGKEVGGVFVAEFVGLIDGGADGLADGGEGGGEGFDVIAAAGDGEGVSGELGFLADRGDGSFGRSAEGGDAFGDVINESQNLAGDAVEEFVEGDEVGAFDVPVGLFGLELQIDEVGQVLVEELANLGAFIGGKIILGRVHSLLR